MISFHGQTAHLVVLKIYLLLHRTFSDEWSNIHRDNSCIHPFIGDFSPNIAVIASTTLKCYCLTEYPSTFEWKRTILQYSIKATY